MRVGVDYRILASGRSAATRGMPRYTQQQLREVLRRDSENEYVLLIVPETEVGLILPEIRNAPNVSVAAVPAAATVDVDNPATLADKASRYSDWIADQGVDLYHATTPFYLEQLVVPAFDVCPMVATLYDLIPMVFPAHYLLSARVIESYFRAARLVAGATRVLAISEAARRDAGLYLGVPADRIDVAWPIAEPFFRPMSNEAVASALTRLSVPSPLPADIFLAVSHLHYTKNIETLLRAWSLVREPIRARTPLVLACHLDPHGMIRVQDLVRRLGISGSLIITGLVSDAELVALYNRARLVIHPSRYEGFGLPVLEAMQCGTPVVTSTTSSLPEVGGDAAVLVDPDDAPALADAITSLYDDAERRSEMSRRGLAQARRFSGSLLAEATIASYRKALGEHGTEQAIDGRDVRRSTTPTLVSSDVGAGAGGAQERSSVNFNKVYEVEDLSDPTLSALIHDLSPGTDGARIRWETAMAIRALRHFGVLRDDARLLGAGAGTADLVFHLAGQVGQVFAVDDYVLDGVASPMLVDPSSISPVPFEAHRLIVQHMDLCDLRFADDTFDAVFSPRAVQGLPGLVEVAAATYEMGRVLRPGGILSLSTDMVLGGPPGGGGRIAGLGLSMSSHDVRRHLIEASGLEPVDHVDLEVSAFTLATPRHMGDRPDGGAAGPAPPMKAGPEPRPPLTVRAGYVVGSVHLTLRKTDQYPYPANRWARPPRGGRGGTREGSSPVSAPSSPRPPRGAPNGREVPGEEASDIVLAAEARLRWARERQADLPTVLSEIMTGQTGLDSIVQDAGVIRNGADAYFQRVVAIGEQIRDLPDRVGPSRSQGDPPGGFREDEGVWCPIDLVEGARLGVLVDPTSDDGVSVALRSGRARPEDEDVVSMMLDLVGPGDVVVDIGAGAGLFSLCAAAAGCVVVAVEASPGDVARLRASVDRNGTRGMRVVHAVVAAADQIVSDQRAAGPAAAVTLEELVAQCGLPEVSVLRLGGADDAVPPIRAVSWLLDRTAAPAVIVHSEGPAACSLELLAGMENLGYSIFGVSPTGLVPAPSSGRGPRRPSLATKSPARLDRGATAVS